LPESDLALLEAAAREAGQLALGHWKSGIRAWDKGDGQGPVTEADLAVDALLRARLTGARPGYGWLSEESAEDPSRLDAQACFIVDPIDGTRAFVAGEKSWAHALAVAVGGVVTAAVVYLPALERLYAAEAGRGARVNGCPMAASRAEGLGAARVLAGREAIVPGRWAEPAPLLDRHFRPALAYRLALVAEGRFDAMLTFRDSWEWDVAAGALIAAEAGAAVTDRMGRPLRFNTPARQTPGVLAGAPGVHAEALARLA